MSSYIKYSEFEYDENEYQILLNMFESFSNEINSKHDVSKIRFLFNFDIQEFVIGRFLTNDEKQIPMLRRVCALVQKSRLNILEKNKHDPNIIRVISLFVYYIVKLQPLKCLLHDMEEKKSGYYDLSMNADFALYAVKYFLRKHNEDKMSTNGCLDYNDKCMKCKKCIYVDFLYNTDDNSKNYKETLKFTLLYKTISKAMIIQLFDSFDKTPFVSNDREETLKDTDKKNKNSNPTISMPHIGNCNSFSISSIDKNKVQIEFTKMLKEDEKSIKDFTNDLIEDLRTNS